MVSIEADGVGGDVICRDRIIGLVDDAVSKGGGGFDPPSVKRKCVRKFVMVRGEGNLRADLEPQMPMFVRFERILDVLD